MTVFCVLFSDVSHGEQPIFISDVLLTAELRHSSDGNRYVKKYIPSIGGTFPQISSGSSISGLTQKTYVWGNGRYCITLAGDLEHVARLYADIKAKTDTLDIAKAIERYSHSLQFAFGMLDSERDQVFLCATRSCRQLTPGSYGSVLIGGSGQATLRKLLLAHQQRPFRADPTLDRIGRALVLVNEALAMDEDEPARTLGECFGAYYEITEFNGHEFVKIGNIAHHYLMLKLIDGAKHWILKKSYYHEYSEGDLIVRRISWVQDDGQDAVWQDCYAINGLGGPLNLNGAKLLIRDTAPAPTFEVLCVLFHGSTFRIVSNCRHLIRMRKDGPKWFTDIDEAVAHDLANAIADALEAPEAS